MEKVLYKQIPEPTAKLLNLQPQRSNKAEAFVKAFLKRSMPRKSQEDIEKRLNRKVLVLEHPRQRKTQQRVKRGRGLSAKQRQAMHLFEIPPEQQRYEIFIPLHELWKQYIRELCNGLKPDAQPQMIQTKLLKADFHGALVTGLVLLCPAGLSSHPPSQTHLTLKAKVTKSKCPSYVGITGIILQETKYVFKIVTKEDKLKVIPKRNNIFSVEMDSFVSYIYGSRIQFRASERSAKKFKGQGTMDL